MPKWELHTFYNPKKDLKALHLGTYPLHLYEIARGSSHETLFFYSMGIQSYTSCPQPTKNPNPTQFFLYLGIHDLKLRSGRSRDCLSTPRLPFNAATGLQRRDCLSVPRLAFNAATTFQCRDRLSLPAHAAAAFNNSLFLLRSSSAGDCKPGKLPELSCLLQYDRNFCIPKP